MKKIEVIIKTAHELGRTVTAHIYNSEQMKKVALMGIDGMEAWFFNYRRYRTSNGKNLEHILFLLFVHMMTSFI